MTVDETKRLVREKLQSLPSYRPSCDSLLEQIESAIELGYQCGYEAGVAAADRNAARAMQALLETLMPAGVADIELEPNP